MTRAQRIAHFRIWIGLAAMVTLLAAFALHRRAVAPIQEAPPALAAEAAP